MVVVAHEDDDLLFINPDIQQALNAGHSMVVVYVTAGDLGDPDHDQYWQDRERGILAAYEHMLGDRDAPAYVAPPATSALWRHEPAKVGPLQFDRFHADSSGRGVDIIFLTLGDYQTQCLWEDTNGCSGLDPNPPAPPYLAFNRTCPGNAPAAACAPLQPEALTRDDLITGLALVMMQYDVDRVATTDSSALHFDLLGDAGASPGYSEYWDHYFVGLFTLSALVRAQSQVGHPIAFADYRGYTIAREPATLDDEAACDKLDTFAHYAMFDNKIVSEQKRASFAECPECALHDDYGVSAPGSWQRRQLSSTSLELTGEVKLRNGDSCVTLGAGGLSLASCAAATAWTVLAGRQLCATNQCLTEAATGAHINTPVPDCNGQPCTPVPPVFPSDPVAVTTYMPGSELQVFYVLDSGQIRTAEGRCLAVENGAVVTADCAAARQGDHVADRPVDAQTWTVAP